jgi:acetolactate synthase I/II/III large subunit
VKVSDFIVHRFLRLGVSRCFAVTGGGAMHLNDSFGEAPGMHCTYMHHEQACAIAAEGFARIAGAPAVVNVTSGPGAINALNGVFGAFTDSIPMIVISGQVKTETLLETVPQLRLRQLGDQEARSEEFIPTFVKRFTSLRSSSQVLEAIDETFLEAVSGRPGPAWIEVPVDIQGKNDSSLDELLHAPLPSLLAPGPAPSHQDVARLVELLATSQRPLLLLGTGVRLSGAQDEVLHFAEVNQLPIVTAWTHDLCDNDHELFVGRPGTIGTRPGNFAVQACDLLIVLGSRLNIRQVSYNWICFAKRAKVVLVDIDDAELCKPYLNPALTIHAHILPFIQVLYSHCQRTIFPNDNELIAARKSWLKRCKEIASGYEAKPQDYIQPDSIDSGINPYHFVFALGKYLRSQDRIVCGDATACIVPFQVLKLIKNQRMFSNSGCASMGYDLSAAIGAAYASSDSQQQGTTFCLAGDGSLMMNIQELQTLRACGLNLGLFILDNNGYLSIKQTQSNFFGREHGASPGSGITFPDFALIARSFGLITIELNDYASLESSLEEFMLHMDGPRVCVVKLFELQEFMPRLKSRMLNGAITTPELDDMFPHLPASELTSVRNFLTESTHKLSQS